MSSYSDTSIVINMIRGDNSKMDDKLTIRKNLEYGDFEFTYSEYNHGNPRVVHTVKGLYRERVINYLYNLFKNFSLDEEPYMDVQYILPAMPSVIVSASKFKDVYYREHFLDMLGNSLDLLENTESLSKTNTRLRSTAQQAQHDIYDEPSQFTTPPSVRQHLYFEDFDY